MLKTEVFVWLTVTVKLNTDFKHEKTFVGTAREISNAPYNLVNVSNFLH